MNWLLLYEIVYTAVLALVCLRIIYDTRTNTKTVAYLLLVLFLPVVGLFVYFSFGINYRKRKMYDKKLIEDQRLGQEINERILSYSKSTFENHYALLESNKELAYMLAKNIKSPLTSNNAVRLLVNGEMKFPEVLEALKKAKHHIHIEYYIYEDGKIGRAIGEILMLKVKEGVDVRFIYDDFGSRSIRKKFSKQLKDAGIKIVPFYKINLIALANRINYRNHRKIIVIDGSVAFVGGINVSDRYINNPEQPQKLFWRDTHLRIEGPAVFYLQYLFFCDWRFCSKEQVQRDEKFFPPFSSFSQSNNTIVQIAASGPDSDTPDVLFSQLQAINLAEKEILITTPYFIPGESIIDALIVAALGGVEVKLLVPGVSDSRIVNAAARSYYGDLLDAGIEVYLYQKGFVHAKTMVTDRKLAIVGTANMDSRSFDLNFEVNALVYDMSMAESLARIFYNDLQDAEKIDRFAWNQRPAYKQLLEKTARLVSPLL